MGTADDTYGVRFTADTAEYDAGVNRVEDGNKRIDASLKAMLATASSLVALEKVAEAFQNIISTGLNFNKSMEESKLGLAALLQSFYQFKDSSGKVTEGTQSMALAMEKAEKIQTELLETAKQSPGTYLELASALQSGLGPAVAAGVTDLTKLKDITLAASIMAKAMGVQAGGLAQELRTLFTGEQGPDNRLNTTLRITKAELDSVRKSGGDVADYLKDKLGSALTAAGLSAEQYGTKLSNLQDAFEQAAGAFTKPIFEALKKELDSTSSALGGFFATLGESGKQVGDLVTTFAPLARDLGMLFAVIVKSGVDAAHTLSPLVEGLGVTVRALTAITNALGSTGIELLLFVKGLGMLQSGALGAITALEKLMATGAGAAAAQKTLTAATEGGIAASQAAAAATGAQLAAYAALVLVVYELANGIKTWSDEQDANAKVMNRVSEQSLAYMRLHKQFPGIILETVDMEKLLKLSRTDQVKVLEDVQKTHKTVAEAIDDYAKKQMVAKDADTQRTAALKKYHEELDKFNLKPLTLSFEDLWAKADTLSMHLKKIWDDEGSVRWRDIVRDNSGELDKLSEAFIRHGKAVPPEIKKAVQALEDEKIAVKILKDAQDDLDNGLQTGAQYTEKYRLAQQFLSGQLDLTKGSLERQLKELERNNAFMDRSIASLERHRAAQKAAQDEMNTSADTTKTLADMTGKYEDSVRRAADARAAFNSAGDPTSYLAMEDAVNSSRRAYSDMAQATYAAEEALNVMPKAFGEASVAGEAFAISMRGVDAVVTGLSEKINKLFADMVKLAEQNELTNVGLNKIVDNLAVQLERTEKLRGLISDEELITRSRNAIEAAMAQAQQYVAMMRGLQTDFGPDSQAVFEGMGTQLSNLTILLGRLKESFGGMRSEMTLTRDIGADIKRILAGG